MRGSGVAITKQLVSDLKESVVEGVAAGNLTVTGPDGAIFARLARRSGLGNPQVAADSVTISNNTGLGITVTTSLNGTSRTITQMIGVGGSKLFNFNSSTGNYITAMISRSDNGQSPPPYTTSLNRPITGYYGKVFPVSISNGFFSVNMSN